MMKPRFVAFISRAEEIPDYESLAPDADFTFVSYSDLGGKVIQIRARRLGGIMTRFSRLHAESPFTAILNRKEKCVVPAARLALHLGLPPITLNPGLARDKFRMRRALNAAGTPVRNVLVKNRQDLPKVPAGMFPSVLKPRFGFNSRSVVRVANRKELDLAYAEQHARYGVIAKQDGSNDHFVVEQYIPGTEHNVETLVRDGRAIVHLLSDKIPMHPPYFVEIGDNMPSTLSAAGQEVCRDSAEKAIQALGIMNGWTHTEVKLDHGQAVVVECAARMGGGYFEELIAAVFGINRMRMLIDLFLGNLRATEFAFRGHASARRVVVYGPPTHWTFRNPEILTRDSRVRLVWPRMLPQINRPLAGPPFDFNNTLFEFLVLEDSAEKAASLADQIIRQAIVMESMP